MKRLSLFPCVILGALAGLSAGCVTVPSQAKNDKLLARADQVVAAATVELGHERFSVCYVDDDSDIGSEVSLQSLAGLGGSSKLIKGTAAGMADNQKSGWDVVMDGPDPAKTDRTARAALEKLNLPLPGLDLVMLHPPSPSLQAAAQKYDVVLHVITVE